MTRISRSRTAVATGLTLGATAASMFLSPAAFAAEGWLPALSVDPDPVAVGETLMISGTDCVAESETDVFGPVVYLDGNPDEDAQPAVLEEGNFDDETGDWTFSITFKSGTAGDHEIDAYCGHYDATTQESTGSGLYPTAYVTVTEASAAPAPSTPTAAPVANPAPATSTAPAADFKPGAKPNTPGTASTSTDKTTGSAAAPGQKVVKVLKGFKPGEKVTVVLHSAPVEVGTFTADANGVVTVEFTVPAGTPLGQHTIAYTGDQGTYFEEALTLTADGKALAYTGTSIAMPLLGGSVLLAAGAGAMVIGRRRRTAGAAQL
jgi:hypothetical protein